MRRVVHEGQIPRPLHENAIRKSWLAWHIQWVGPTALFLKSLLACGKRCRHKNIFGKIIDRRRGMPGDALNTVGGVGPRFRRVLLQDEAISQHGGSYWRRFGVKG